MYGADLLVQSLGEARGCQTRLASGLPLDRVGELGAICGTLVRILCWVCIMHYTHIISTIHTSSDAYPKF